MTMLLTLLCFYFNSPEPLTFPEPMSQWTVTFESFSAALGDDGRSCLGYGQQIFHYDVNGNLIDTVDLTFRPEIMLVGPQGKIWVHDGTRLGTLGQRGLLWQETLPLPVTTPVHFDHFLVYATRDAVNLIEGEEGRVVYSLARDEPIRDVKVLGQTVLVGDEDGNILMWYPLLGVKRWLARDLGVIIKDFSMARDEPGIFATTTAEGHLMLWRWGKKQLWARDYGIAIDQAPLWLQDERGESILLSTTLGRSAYVYDEKGLQRNRQVMQGRPLKTIPFSKQQAMIVPNLTDRVFFYDAVSNDFVSKDLGDYQLQAVENAGFVLLVGAGGIIRLFQRENPDTIDP